jgi:hypothetical protein
MNTILPTALATIPWGEGLKVMGVGLSGVFFTLGLVYLGTRGISAGANWSKNRKAGAGK